MLLSTEKKTFFSGLSLPESLIFYMVKGLNVHSMMIFTMSTMFVTWRW